jgi:Fur family ferric uptake transcriptional regulator
MTKARAAVLAILEGAEQPLGARDIAASLKGRCDQATVYRTLHYLEERGLADSFVLHCHDHGSERFYAARGGRDRHWFHCELCHAFIELGFCAIEPLIPCIENDHGVKVRRHSMSVEGLCGQCFDILSKH